MYYVLHLKIFTVSDGSTKEYSNENEGIIVQIISKRLSWAEIMENYNHKTLFHTGDLRIKI